jgi:hypothetical protein
VLLRHDKPKWDALSAEDMTRAEEAADDLARRHKAAERSLPVAPLDPRLKVVDASTPPDTFSRPVQVYPAGYSADGKFAAVSLVLPWSVHHADGTYRLRRDARGAWTIVLRDESRAHRFSFPPEPLNLLWFTSRICDNTTRFNRLAA